MASSSNFHGLPTKDAGWQLPQGRSFMITRRGLLEAAGGVLAFGGGGALTAPARGAESTKSGLLWLSPLLPAGTRPELGPVRESR